MRFFFILRLPEEGTHVMQRGLEIALRDGNTKRASEHIVQMVALAHRGNDMRAARVAKTMLERITPDKHEVCGNVELTRAVLASFEGDMKATEEHARAAVTHFEVARNAVVAKSADGSERADLEGFDNDLSGACGKLGDALLGQNRIQEARAAYKRSFGLLRGAAIAVNDGQLLHQVGNCESQLGQYPEAAECYAQAARRFQALGMREYLSNALGELGYALIELDGETAIQSVLPLEVLSDGLTDAAEHVARCFLSPSGIDLDVCGMVIRKLFGVFVVSSLSDGVRRLDQVACTLYEQVIEPSTDLAFRDNVESSSQFAMYHLNALVGLMSSTAIFEHNVETNEIVNKTDIEELSKACLNQGPWAELSTQSFNWLSIYLRRKWQIRGVTAGSLRAAIGDN